MLAVGETVGIGNRPTAGSDCLGSRSGDCLGAACIPGIEQHERLAGNMQRAKLLRIAVLLGHFFSLDKDQRDRRKVVIPLSIAGFASVCEVLC